MPPYVTKMEDADLALEVLGASVKRVLDRGFTHHGAICDFVHCGRHHA